MMIVSYASDFAVTDGESFDTLVSADYGAETVRIATELRSVQVPMSRLVHLAGILRAIADHALSLNTLQDEIDDRETKNDLFTTPPGMSMQGVSV